MPKHSISSRVSWLATSCAEGGRRRGFFANIWCTSEATGLGRLGFEAALTRDYPVMFGTLFFFTLLGLFIKLISDLTYVWIDPRIDFENRQT